jgi:RNA polymerase sigma factor (sigma-70 family)
MRVSGCIQVQTGRLRRQRRPQSLDRAFLNDLYDGHYCELIRVAALLTGDCDAAEQIVLGAFADTYHACARLGPERQRAYLRSRVVMGARSGRAAGVGTRPLVAAPSANQGADAHAMAEAIAALASVPSRYQEAIVLRYYANLTDAEIAESLGISVRSVHRHLGEGIAAFGAALPAADH